MPQLEIQSFLSQFFWLILMFCALYYFVATYFIPRVSSIVEKRRAKIAQDIQIADLAFEQHKVLKLEIEHRINEVRTKALELRNSAAMEAKRYTDKKFAKLEDELAMQMKDEDARLELLKLEYRKGIPDSASSLAKSIFNIIISSFKQQVSIK